MTGILGTHCVMGNPDCQVCPKGDMPRELTLKEEVQRVACWLEEMHDYAGARDSAYLLRAAEMLRCFHFAAQLNADTIKATQSQSGHAHAHCGHDDSSWCDESCK